MRARLAAIAPKSLAGQFVLLLVAALVFANVVALVLLNSEQSRFAREARRGVQVERLAALVPVLERIPPHLRDEAARASSGPTLDVTIDARPMVRSPGTGWLAKRLEDALEARLGDRADGARFEIETTGPRRRWHRDEDDSEGSGWFRGMGPRWGGRRATRVDASIPLAEGVWLNVRQRRPERRPPVVSGAVLFALVLSLAAVLGVSLLYLRRITRPLSALGQAAALAGAGDRTARVPEQGAREIKDAAVAFNTMQAEIAAFDAERARTIAAVGHDLRTPITSLRIRAEMLDDATRDAMVRTLDEMGVMADGLLAWGKNEADVEAPEALDLAELVGALCDPDDGPIVFEGPRTSAFVGRKVALSRAFGNIIGNARRYGERARVVLDEAPDQVLVTVTDEGPGIPPDRFEEVFEPFARLDPSRSAETGGTGLGLSIARTIVRAHGGTIALANRSDRSGLVVRVNLPRRTAIGSPHRRRTSPQS